MDKLCLIFVKFRVSYLVNAGNGYSPITNNIISIREIVLKEAKEIKSSFVDFDISDHRFHELNHLNPISCNIEIIKDKKSIKTHKKCFGIKNGSYNSTKLDLINMIKKYMLYSIYDNIIADAVEINSELGYGESSTFLGNLSDSLNDFHCSNEGLTYQDFKSNQDFLDIVNDIENIQGRMALPSIKEKMKTIPNYENELIGIIGSYLKSGW